MEDNRTELQKKFEEQTPTIKGKRKIEYLQTFVSWLHLQVEQLQGEKLPIHIVSKSVFCEDCKHNVEDLLLMECLNAIEYLTDELNTNQFDTLIKKIKENL